MRSVAAGDASMPLSRIEWRGARRIIRTLYPTIHLFEDIADPADWPLLISAALKTNPRIMETLGNLDLVPPNRRVGGPGASYLMAPFTHVSTDRPSRFSRGLYGVLYVAEQFNTALFETMHHHGVFMACTREPAGWSSQFRELVLDISVDLEDLRGGDPALAPLIERDDYTESQAFAERLRANNSEGLVYPSQRDPDGECAGLFYPDRTTIPVQGLHLDYHWDGNRVDLYRDAATGAVYRVGA